MKMSKRVLIVDDQPSDLAFPYHVTQQLGLEPTIAFNGTAALEELLKGGYSMVILDWNMPGGSAPEFLSGLEKTQLETPIDVVLYSGENLRNRLDPYREARRFSIVDIWRKPIGALEMLKRIKQIRERGYV